MMMLTAREDPVVFEVTTTLGEWHKIWLSLYLDNQVDLFDRIGSLLVQLIDLRAELLVLIRQVSATHDATSGREQQINELKSDIVRKLDLGNRLLNLDLVPRENNFQLVDPIALSPIKLYQLHTEAASSVATIGDGTNSNYGFQDPTLASTSGSSLSTTSSEHHSLPMPAGQASYHLQLSLKNHYLTSLPSDELVEIYFSIVDAFSNSNSSHSSPLRLLTDKFVIQIKNDQILFGVSNTVFKNLGSISDACLYVQVYRVGRMTLSSDGHKSAFGRQQSGSSMQSNSQDGSTSSISTTNKYIPNGLTRSVNSSIAYQNSQSRYKRPFGTTLVPLKEFTKSLNIKETSINLKIVAQNESEFSLMQELYSKRNHSIKNNQNLPNIHLDLAVKLISCTQESLSKLSTAVPYCLTEKRGFPDIVMPGDFKNDLYFTLECGEFEKGGKSIPKNIEASISLIDKSGLAIPNCISVGSNCDNVTCHKSCVFYHSNSPRWNESIKINVPLAEFDSSHIRIEFRHCSTKERDKKFLGFSFLPLSDEDGTVIADKSHELYLYKCDPQLWEEESLNLSKYTSLHYGPTSKLQSNSKSASMQHNFNHSSREMVTISTFLLSTKLTQNSNLLNLLKWRELIKRDKKEFEEALRKVLDMKGEEIVKFLQDILDTLFDTFTLFSASEDDCSALIFKVLVHIFILIDEPRYQHFRQVLDTYASAHFSATLVYKGLLACIKKCLDYSSVVERQAPIQRCFKCIKYVFQFIVQSKLLYSKATGEQNDEPFLNDLRHLFKLFEDLLKMNNAKLNPIQVTFLEYFPGTLEQLIKVVSEQELAQLIVALVGGVGFDITRLPPNLSRAKLLFIKGTAGSSLIKNQDIRLQITENFCRHLEFYIKSSEELDLCYEVLEILIVKIHDYHWPAIYRLHQLTYQFKPSEVGENVGKVITVGEINVLTKSSKVPTNQLDLAIASVAKELEPFVNLMDSLLQLIDRLDFTATRPLVQKYCTTLLTILKLMGRASFEQFMNKRRFDYFRICNIFRSLRAVYNRDWSVMQLTSHAILEQPIDEISRDIRSKNDGPSMNRQFSSYIKLIVDFITHPTLQLESFSERKKNYILSVFGDLRLKFNQQLMHFWSEVINISSRKANIIDLIPTSIHPFLDAALLPNNELQITIIPVFYDMIDAQLSQDLNKDDHNKSISKQLERCFIDNLDLFFNLDRENRMFVDNFENILTNLFKEKSSKEKPNPLEHHGIRLINSFAKLMRLLMDYRQSLHASEIRYKRMSCLVELLNFYKEQDRADLHHKYLFKLCDMHLEVGNHIEAAFTLKLYTDELKWTNTILSSLDGHRPEEQEWRRKEILYQRIVHYFDIGKCWEENIPLCKEMASFYETKLVDYEKVSATLKKLAHFLDCILTEHRPEREYFRVEFYGTNLPNFVKGKEFIYRGGEYERLAAFMQRMNSEFPDGQILNSRNKQTVTQDSPGQFMVISNVKPVPFLQSQFNSEQQNINDKIIHYYLHNRLDTFSYDLPIIKSANGIPIEKPVGEINVKHLWVGRYMLKLKKQLPHILPWSEVVFQEYIEISPINHAIETISSMNLELSKLIISYKSEPNKQISPLTMRLQGVIEAAVNGGPSVFVNAFLKRQQCDGEQYEPKSLIKLRDLIRQQFSILDTGLALHAKLASPEVKPLHDRLVERLHSTKKILLEEATLIPENNYELLNINDGVSNCVGRCDTISTVSMTDSYARDEVDGHGAGDVNGNIYGVIDDQTYSQPIESHSSRNSIFTNGSKSELSSPSRYYASSASSSMSTLAVLSNLPINRSKVSLTPSKEVNMLRSSLNNNLTNKDLCARAARKLTYDSNNRPSPIDGLSSIMSLERLSQISSNGISDHQKAPPLPPRSILTDKLSASRTMNISPVMASRNQSPSDSCNHRWTIHSNDGVLALNLTPTVLNQVSQSLDKEGYMSHPIRTSLPSNLPRILKSPPVGGPSLSGHRTQNEMDPPPPPLPQRARLPMSNQLQQSLLESNEFSTGTLTQDKVQPEEKKSIDLKDLSDRIILNLQEDSLDSNESKQTKT